jgi:hypothetical protein
MVAPRARFASLARIASSNVESAAELFRFRQPSEQYFTSLHERSHFLRHSMVRPQTTQGFDASIPAQT